MQRLITAIRASKEVESKAVEKASKGNKNIKGPIKDKTVSDPTSIGKLMKRTEVK